MVQSNIFNSKSIPASHLVSTFVPDLIQSVRVLITLVKGLPLIQHTRIACQLHVRHCTGHTGCKTKGHPISLCYLQSLSAC